VIGGGMISQELILPTGLRQRRTTMPIDEVTRIHQETAGLGDPKHLFSRR
jgi:hypothetical protein